MRRPAALLLLVLLVVAVGSFIHSLAHPRFPGEGDLPIELPPLRVPSALCYELEHRRILLTLKDYDRTEFRFSWDPGDGLPRVREVSEETKFPRPAAALVVAGATDFLPGAMRSMEGGRRDAIWDTRVYLGGLTANGGIGAVPFQAHPVVCEELTRMGWNPFPVDPHGNRVIEVRITREGDRVRYRWGTAAYLAVCDGPRFSGGDESFTADEVAGPGEGPLLPALAKRLCEEVPSEHPMWKGVLLQVGSGVRYVDILRAVECGPGKPEVTFQFYPGPHALELVGLPPPPPGCADVLGERLDLAFEGASLSLWLERDKTMVFDRKGRKIEDLPARLARLEPGSSCALYIDRSLPFAVVLPVIRQVRAAGHQVCFILDQLDPNLDLDAMFRLPEPGDDPATVRLKRVGEELVPVSPDHVGGALRVLVPAGAGYEETLRALIRLRTSGASAFSFSD